MQSPVHSDCISLKNAMAKGHGEVLRTAVPGMPRATPATRRQRPRDSTTLPDGNRGYAVLSYYSSRHARCAESELGGRIGDKLYAECED
jgi:hypothetical protein